ncbi:hypothetical protein WISP_72043 [Willisornis vidua]|uniref:Uncharacterized protein n=1 Tax=Willisornis vidua TaxID=1566151 RepID=A0ABQ9D7I0_9PASS|nr:hypothetical protein WISP_72043 [Willisornis vidua]
MILLLELPLGVQGLRSRQEKPKPSLFIQWSLSRADKSRVGNAIRDVENAIRDARNAIRDVENAIRDVGNAMKEMGNAIRDVGNAIREMGNAIKEMGNAIRDVASAIRDVSSISFSSRGTSGMSPYWGRSCPGLGSSWVISAQASPWVGRFWRHRGKAPFLPRGITC